MTATVVIADLIIILKEWRLICYHKDPVVLIFRYFLIGFGLELSTKICKVHLFQSHREVRYVPSVFQQSNFGSSRKHAYFKITVY